MARPEYMLERDRFIHREDAQYFWLALPLLFCARTPVVFMTPYLATFLHISSHAFPDVWVQVCDLHLIFWITPAMWT
jgi:hypothetical protein